MAITTLDGAIAGMQWPRYFAKAVTAAPVAGRPQSLWSLGGTPGAGAFDTTLNGVVLSGSSTQVAGQVPFTDPVSGNSYLARFQAAATTPGTLLLCDRLWHNGGYSDTLTTAQASTTPTWPARDGNGSTNGDGVLLGVEISGVMGAFAPTITVSYTNQAGATGHTGTNSWPVANSAVIGSFFPIGLQAGDSGVRAVASLTLNTSWSTGTFNLVAYRPLAALELTAAFVPNAIDAITAGFPRIYNGTVPFFLFIPNSTTAVNVSGQVVWTQG